MRTYKIFTWRLANKLFNAGYKPVGKTLNLKDPTQEVILFEDTPEFRETLKNILNAERRD